MITKPKGTYDVNGDYGKKLLYVENLFRAVMEKYNYEYVRTPIFEASSLFHRGVGETSDIVSKETYDFKDRGNRDMTLRPEGTAGVVRSFLENKMYGRDNKPVKTWYYGPMYRYERPQAGRCREFYQFGVEVFGSNSPILDAEVISIPVNLYRLLGLKGIKVKINTLGDYESRQNYRNALLKYFKPYIKDLCSDCQVRYEKNPLRILDCKIDSHLDIMEKAPKTIDYLNETSKQHFEEVQKYLDVLEIEYEIDSKVVRGLDYYTHTIFEVEALVEGFGAQNVLCGGGRYDNLVNTLGDIDVPGVGFAMGMERLMTALDFEQIQLVDSSIDLYIIPMGEEALTYSVGLLEGIRMNGFKADMDYMSRNMKGNFKQADRLHSKFIAIIGDDEVKSKIITIKDNTNKEEFKIKEEDLILFLDEHIEEDK